MKISEMKVKSFWKGEVGVEGLAEDGEGVFRASLYLKNGQVRDYSCTCKKGNSYRGLCAHGEALFAFYEKSVREAAMPPVHSSPQIHALIREYTNREVAAILEEEEEEGVRLWPVLWLEGNRVELELKAGRKKLYSVQNIEAFVQAVETGAYAEYGKELAFYHRRASFQEDSRELLDLIVSLAAEQGRGKRIVLNPLTTDRFFKVWKGEQLEVSVAGREKRLLELIRQDPKPEVCILKEGRDGLRIVLKGFKTEGEMVPLEGMIEGRSRICLIAGERCFVCSASFTEAAASLFKQLAANRAQGLTVGAREIPLFYQRVLKAAQPWFQMELKDVDPKMYEPEPLKAEFWFDADETGKICLEPWLSYGSFRFRPVDDETVPRTVCRDVPGEFRVSQVIRRYFCYPEQEQGRLTLKDGQDGLYRLLDRGMEEFRALGQIYLAEEVKKWRLRDTPGALVHIRAGGSWLDLDLDSEGYSREEIGEILAAYSEKKRFVALKNGQIVRLGAGGLFRVSQMAQELGVSRKELLTGTVRLPAYRALYLDGCLRGQEGIRCFRDSLFKAVVQGVRWAGEGEPSAPDALKQILRPYQTAGYSWMKTLSELGFGGILADEMGLGKTIQVIALLEQAYQQGEKAFSLIVCPASLVYNWECEIRRFAPERTAVAVTGSGAEREQLLTGLKEGKIRAEILITSYDLLKRDIGQYADFHFRYQIIDEAQNIKNARTLNAKAVKAICSDSRFALTGTPVENHLGELWSMFDFLMPGFLFTERYFRRAYEVPIVKEEDEQALERLKELISPFVLRRVKKEVLKELPDKLERVVYSRLGTEQRKLYEARAQLLKEELEGEGASGEKQIRLLSHLMRLRQICCDPALCYANYRGESAKLETCMDLIFGAIQGGHRLLLFSQFASMLEILEERLHKEQIACLKLTGDTPGEERFRMAEEFEHGTIPVFLISLKAGGTGLNLTAADVVIHYDPWWNLAAQNQATDRTHRIGQQKQVTVYRLIARNTIEEGILRLQEAKGELAHQVLSGEGFSLASLTKEELLRLAAAHEDQSCDAQQKEETE